MPQWQYRVVDLNDAPRGSDEIDVLNDAGGEGWELIGITANNIAYMKRQIVPPAQTSRRKSLTDAGQTYATPGTRSLVP